jgi:DNA-binding response OmpR family regulator
VIGAPLPEARRAIEQEAFDITVIDATVPPPEDGYRLAEFASSRRIGIIMISGDPSQTARMESGPPCYLTKPFRVADMMSRI